MLVRKTMSDTEDDEQLSRAIALSLQKPSHDLTSGAFKNSEASAVVIDLTEDPQEQTTSTLRAERIHGPIGKPTDSFHERSDVCFLGLNRKEMEEQRLARQRKASISPPPARRERRIPEEVRAHSAEPTPDAPLQPRQGSLLYPRGVVKKTWAFGYPRKDDFKIEEVLQKADLQLAVLSAFQWDIDWLLRKISPDRTKMIFVMQAKEDALVSGWALGCSVLRTNSDRYLSEATIPARNSSHVQLAPLFPFHGRRRQLHAF